MLLISFRLLCQNLRGGHAGGLNPKVTKTNPAEKGGLNSSRTTKESGSTENPNGGADDSELPIDDNAEVNATESNPGTDNQSVENPNGGANVGNKKKKTDEKMRLERSPSKFIDMMASLSDRQLAAVVDMGFGHLFNFGVAEIPSRMSYHLLVDFDVVTCTIKVGDTRLHITDDDVYLTLGLPKGNRIIQCCGHQLKQAFIDEVAKCVGKDRVQLLPEDFIGHMSKDKAGGDLFIKLFIIVLDTILIALSADGYCKCHIQYILNDIANIKNYNWCAYVLDSLIRAQPRWMKNKHTPFTGPICFLVGITLLF